MELIPVIKHGKERQITKGELHVHDNIANAESSNPPGVVSIHIGLLVVLGVKRMRSLLKGRRIKYFFNLNNRDSFKSGFILQRELREWGMAMEFYGRWEHPHPMIIRSRRKLITENEFYGIAKRHHALDLISQPDEKDSSLTDREEIQGPDIIESNVEKGCFPCDKPKAKDAGENQACRLIPEVKAQHHPVKAAILKALKEKVASGIDPKEAYVKNGQIRLLFPDVSRKAITRHFNALIKANLIKRVDRVKYYLHSDTNQ